MPRKLGGPPDSPDSASSSNLYSASEDNGAQDSASSSSDSQILSTEDAIELSSEDDETEARSVGILSPDKRESTIGGIHTLPRVLKETIQPEGDHHSMSYGHSQNRPRTGSRRASTQPIIERDPKRKRSPAESSSIQQLSTTPLTEEKSIFEESAPMSSRAKRAKIEDSSEQSTIFDDRSMLPLDRSKLPAEIWHYIFAYVSPVSLGRLLQVNKSFNSYLVPSAQQSPVFSSGFKGLLRPQPADAIWSAARKIHFPIMPKPVRSLSELENWSLILGTTCQLCMRKAGPILESSRNPPWDAGPGTEGVRVVWPFGVRCCGSCLSKYTEKEMTLFLSPQVPSFLVPALPFALLTSDWHVIPSTTLANSSPPSTVQMTKSYYKPDIESIKRELEEVKSLGSAATEEWIKGLDGKGKDRMGEAARWERWEDKYRAEKSALKGLTSGSAATSTINAVITSTAHSNVPIPPSTPQLSTPTSNDHNFDTLAFNGNSAQPIVSSFSVPNLSGPPPRTFNSPAMGGFLYPSQGSLHHPRTERNIHDVNEAKAARRAEIERRCLEFQPPLLPSVLNHMESFQAAILIPTPLTNNSWEVLKPRLLAQQELAERRENERIAQQRASQAKFEERRQQESHLKEAKEVLDREWDEAQVPIRERLGVYADEIIRDKWADGKSITKDTSPKFAADVLLYSRERFYADIAKADAAARATGETIKQDPPSGPPTRKLILENMKWLFDTKIKPLSEQYRKELFLCNGCDNNFKFYGFEGVIQHYAAKHTNTLSMGSIIVHWRAEWPEHSPFHPDPSAAKAAFYAVPTPVSGPGQAPGGALPHSSFSHNGYPPSLGPGSQMASQGPHAFPQFSPGPYNQSQYSDHYAHNQYGPFAPPAPQHQNYPGPSQGFQVLPPNYHQSNANNSNYQSGFHSHPRSYQGYTGSYQGAPSQAHGSPYPAPSYPYHGQEQGGHTNFGNGVPGPFAQPLGPGPPFAQSFSAQAPSVGPGPPSSHLLASGQPTGIYQVQIEEMAQNARDIWFGTSGIKDLPGSVRIYVVVQHVVTNFKAKFTNEPSLAMFTDGLASHALMKPIKGVNGLACKACVNSGNGSGVPLHSYPPPPSSGERRLYALPSLLSHFQSIHIERAKPTIIPQTGITTPRLDWKEDMIELPEDSMIQDLIHAPGMDDQKLQLIAQAFPAYFPSPLPRIGLVRSTGPIPILKDDFDHEHPRATEYVRLSSPHESVPHDFEHHSTSRRSEPIITGETSGHVENDRQTSLERPSNDDEYDPHRPAYLGPEYHRAIKLRQHRKGDSHSLYPEDNYLRGSSRREPENINDVRTGTRESRSHELDIHANSRRYEGPHQRTSSRLRSVSPQATSSQVPYGARPESGVADADPEFRQSHTQSFERPAKDREYSIPPAQIKVSKSPHQSQDVSMPQAVEAGSEDGEVGDLPGLLSNAARGVTPSEEMSAAERFLHEFLPGQDPDEYKRKQAEHDRRKDGQLKAKWAIEQENDSRANENGATSPETRSWREDFHEGRTRESSLGEIPIRKVPLNARNGHGRNSPFTEVVRAEGEYDAGPRYAQMSTSRARERSPELVDPRYIQNSAVYHRNHRQSSDHPRRPRSRYERYEAQRHEDIRTRSRSPRRSTKPSAEDSYYRTREPSGVPHYEPIYRSDSPSLSRSRISADEGLNYHRVHAQPQYRYVEDTRGYRPAYENSLEYIPVRVASHDQQGLDRYVVSRPIERTTIGDYIPYDHDRHGEQLYEHNGQVYSRRPRVYQGRSDPREDSIPGPQY